MYKISKYPTGLNKQEVDKEIAKAFSVWSSETDLTFTRKSGHENVRICRNVLSLYESFKSICSHGANRNPDVGSFRLRVI